ncbi:hypothetical protein CCR81_11865 [Halorhodospira halophila]|nr:hypothetical protein [Halorhodospira halophila]
MVGGRCPRARKAQGRGLPLVVLPEVEGPVREGDLDAGGIQALLDQPVVGPADGPLHPRCRLVDFDADWLGGFFCPCHGARYDMAGRVYRAQPAPRNLEVPPHRQDGDKLVIGEHPEDADA